MSRLLVVAGEGSGDAFAAPVVARLAAASFGLGGSRLAAAGTELVADLRPLSAMGVLSPLGHAPALARALVALVRAVRRERPRAALLVGFSEVNARLAAFLRARRIRVLWYAPPQVWAWRPSRAQRLAHLSDQLAVILPFEAPLWQGAGARVEYVGHPALEHAAGAEPASPPSGGVVRVAVLPGSRSQEIRAHLSRMVGAARKVRERLHTSGTAVEVAIVRAAALDAETARYVAETARASDVSVTDSPLPVALAGHHVAIAASGTATLECAVLAVPPVIVYRTDPVTHAIARRLVRVPHIGLPNLVLDRRAFPELVQRRASPGDIADAVRDVLAARPSYLAECGAVKRALGAGLDGRTPSMRVADLLAPWLA